MSRSEPTAFSLEGELRHRLRSSLCRQGADWILADLLAAAIVEDALRNVGAQRPTWQHGQPEWSEEGVIYIQRPRRIRCRRPPPPGHRPYYPHLCAPAPPHALARRFNADRTRVLSGTRLSVPGAPACRRH